VAQALDLTAAEHRIRADEIGLIEHGDGVYTVVLPGVTDLSRPSTGWNPDHRSVRDLDMAALDSARSSAMIDNRYAGAVAEALDRAGVEPAARLTVVGHSYGADTALDLAADRRFNGQRYRVEYVVAAGYYSQPQLRHVPPSTDVLVLQNRRDVVIEAERLARWAVAPMESLAATVMGTAATGTGTRSGVTVVGFNGGSRGAGHHPENYRRWVQRRGSRPSPGIAGTGSTGSMEEVDRFLTGVGAGPWGRGGRLDAVNVSVPT
jgi:pimeloyl-ACP methyl ester carboxylesterase